jgi:DNA-binding CsgD family transcriptional regulator/tetratricopeptide (TPR) repeat protein
MQLVERGGLLERLDACLDEARTAGHLVLVGGEAGVGKTSLVRCFVGGLPDGFRVLWGACDPLSTPRPLAPFQDMSPLTGVLEEEQGKHGLLSALLGELSGGTVMVVEDAHWADEATLDALRFIGRRVSGTRSVVLVTFRDDEIGPDHPLRVVLGDLATAARCERLQVPALTLEGVRALIGGEALDSDRVYRVTGGNAFYVSEVLAAPAWTVPLTVTDAVLARVSRVSVDARGLIDLVSVVPGGLEPEVAARLIEGAAAALDEAVERGVLVLFGSRVSFRHELARLAIEGTLAGGRRRELNARLVEVLEARADTDPARLAHHAEAAGDVEGVLRYAPAAAREASSRGAHREAARQLERAVAHADGLPASELADLLSLWAEERRAFDVPSEVVELLTRVVELRRQTGDALGVGLTLTLLGRSLMAVGRTGEGIACTAEAIEVLEPLGEGPELAHAYAAYSLHQMNAPHGDEAIRWGRRAVELAERVGVPSAQLRGLNAIGTAQLQCFEQLEGIEALERAVRLGKASGEDFEVARALANLGFALCEIRQYERAAPYLEQAISFSEERDLDYAADYARAELAKVRFAQGGWEEADRLAEEALQHRVVSGGIRLVGLCVRGRVAARRGDPEAAAFLDEAWELSHDAGDLSVLSSIAAGRAELAWLAGRADNIPPLVEPTYEQARALGLRWAAGELGHWLVRAGALARLPEGVEVPYALPWREATEAWRQIGCPYEQAEALAEGDGPAMREGLEIFTRLGAEHAADQLRERMRRTGIKGVPARPRASTRSAPAQLTRRQLDVLILVEQGLSNAEIARALFISEKTAIHHVTAILRKLGVRRRGEAAAAARKMGIPTTPT